MKPLKILGVIVLGIAMVQCYQLYQSFHLPRASTKPLEVVIPLAPKDLDILPAMVASVREYLQHPIDKIVVIAPNVPEIRAICHALSLECLDENRVYSKTAFMAKVRASGIAQTDQAKLPATWFYQQLLKLYYAHFSTQTDYLVMDADIVLQRPLTMKTALGAYRFFLMDSPYREDYRCGVRAALGWDTLGKESYGSKIVLFHKEIVANMVKDIEKHMKLRLPDALLAASSQRPDCLFSVSETYGEYMAYTTPNIPRDMVTIYYLARERRYVGVETWWQHFYQFVAF